MIYKGKKREIEPFDLDYYLKTDEENLSLLKKIDKEAKDKGDILYRYFTEPFADGEAIYQVIKVNKKTVRIRVCLGIGDEWVIPYLGEECSISKEYVESKINHRDTLDEMFKKNE